MRTFKSAEKRAEISAFANKSAQVAVQVLYVHDVPQASH